MGGIDDAPVVGTAEFQRLAEIHNWVEAEEIPTDPLVMADGRKWLRSRPGRLFIKNARGSVVAVASQCQA